MSIVSRRNALLAMAAASSPARAAEDILRLGISESLVRDVSIADAKAAMVVWMKRIASELRLDLRYIPEVFESAENLTAKLKQGLVDTVAMNLLEYRRVREWLDPREITVPSQKTALTYVLLVRSDSGVAKVADLRGRRLLMLDSLQTCIAPAWLSTLIGTEAQESAGSFFSAVSRKPKPSQVILPVFFGQVEACLTTQLSFLTAGELNPQILSKLRPLAVSPEIVASLYAFRKGWDGGIRARIIRAMTGLASSASGRQVLTLFQCESLLVRDVSCLNEALSILARSERAIGRNGSAL